MKFSLFYEMQISEPTPEKERQNFLDCVTQVELADKLGYYCIWAVEHHGLYEYSHSCAPEVFLSFIAARTENVRIGHGVTLMPYKFNHPIRIAERVATLDILSGGRVNWGSGKSASLVEQMAFENDIPTLHEQWEETVKMIPDMWSKEVYEYKGKYFDIPPTMIIPKPVQKPHPPMFAACTKPDSAATVGALGFGALNFAVGDDVYLKEKVREYRKAVEASNPVGYEKTNHFASTGVSCVLPDDNKACKYGFRGARFFTESLSRYYFGNDRPVGPLVDINRDFLNDEDLKDAMANRSNPQATTVIGDPSKAKETIDRFAACGVDELILVMQAGTIPHEIIMESIKTFGEEVIPQYS